MMNVSKKEVVATESHASNQMQTILVPRTFDQLVIFANLAAESGMVPKEYVKKPGAIMVACQMGSELGLSPMQSLLSIAVINGRPGVWGDGLIGLCRQSPLCEDIIETMEGDGDKRTAKCIAKRRGSSPIEATFSVQDAMKAGLWGRNVWAAYPDRMLRNRARGFALRDAFPDLLRGLKTVEELRDTPRDTFRGATLDADLTPDETISKAPPPLQQPKKRTTREWLNSLYETLQACHTAEEVETIAASEQVVKALAALKNGALAELEAMLAEAEARVNKPDDPMPEPDDDVFPGDVPLDE